LLQTTKSSRGNREKRQKNYKDPTSVSIGLRHINPSRPRCGKSIYVQHENDGFTKLLLAFVYALNPEFSLLKRKPENISY
jgi:hypothetical protein